MPGKTILSGDLGAINLADIFSLLEIVYSLFHWRSGFFEFVEGEADAKEKITLSMSTTKVIMEGIHRLDEWAKMRTIFPDDAVVLEPVLGPEEVGARPDLGPEDRKLLALIDGSRTLAEISGLARQGEFECYSILFNLVSTGVLRVRGAQASARRAAR